MDYDVKLKKRVLSDRSGWFPSFYTIPLDLTFDELDKLVPEHCHETGLFQVPENI
jgi:hypothetical protein